MSFTEKLAEMGFEGKIIPYEGGFRVELIDTHYGNKTVVSKVSGIPNVEGAQEILGLMAHKHRLTHRSVA
jgi:hypothetical protein